MRHAWSMRTTVSLDEVLVGQPAAVCRRRNVPASAQLAALALEHGLAVCSADSDFACFAEVSWVDPLA